MPRPEAVAANPAVADSPPDVERLVMAERIALLYQRTPYALLMALLFSAFIVAIYWSSTAHATLLAWGLLINGTSLARYALIRAYRRAAPPPEQAARWNRPFILLTALAGVSWGLLGVITLPEQQPAYQLLTWVFLIGIGSVGMFSLYSSMPAYAALILPMLFIPGVWNVLFSARDTDFIIGFMVPIFSLVALSNALRSQSSLSENLRLRFQNARVAADLELALARAHEANETKSRFLANMSHELRTPLTSILGLTQLLLDRELHGDTRARLKIVHQSGQHLLETLNDILDYSRLEAGRLDIETRDMDPRASVAEVCRLMSDRAADKGLEFQVTYAPGLPPLVRGDPARIRQMLRNLIANAIKFTDAGWVRVHLSRQADPPDGLRFAVRDSGIGIGPADLQSLFESFRRLDGSWAHKFGGTGLGLAICKQLAERMGGQLGCDSTPGMGSTFWFTLPLPEAHGPSRPDATASSIADAITNPRLARQVLLVEDNPVNGMVTQAMLDSLGVASQRVENGIQAVSAATAWHYDLILMDCQMPEMDGFEATQLIRAHERQSGLPATPIVALTADVMRGDREHCLASGMDDYLAKPITREDLRDTLAKYLPLRGSRPGA